MRDDDARDGARHDPPVNEGVMISGGTHYVGNQAVGRGAQAFSGSVSFQQQDSGRTAELLAQVERLLEEHRTELADPDGTTRELRRLREELDEPQPEPGVVRRALDRLNEFVQPVAPLVVAVGQLAQSVQGLPGI
ncbi:DUF5955 family protein [Streptomyces regalis]|uniref:Uncharacterized protein n=1 Tax=Streptomyces regalis TaxID=68262 RepID=A0A0X3VFV7_9ACTN|nr:DUF5955 family protein [Streptomyces regalis]KUL43474.1 hypothetical protein ADL12_07735 [Streptomyces regalis]